VASAHEEIVVLFREMLTYYDELGLLGKEVFAIDGLKLPGNAASARSGTKADLKKKQLKLEQAIRRLLTRVRENY